MTDITKGIATQLRDGSERLDEMKQKIVATACILQDQFQGPAKHKMRFIFHLDCKGKYHDGHTNISYQWSIFPDKLFNVITRCIRITDTSLIEMTSQEILVLKNNDVTKSLPSVDVQNVDETLDEFVSNVFSQFPKIKQELEPLLKAGK